MKPFVMLCLVLVSSFALAQEIQLTRTAEIWSNPQIAPDETTIYAFRTTVADGRRISQIASFRLDRRQAVTALTSPTIDYEEFELSPDGSRIAAIRLDENNRYQIYLIDTATRTETPLTGGDLDHCFPAWSANGQALAACVFDSRSFTPVRRLAVVDFASGNEEILTLDERNYWSPRWFGNERIVMSGDAAPRSLVQELFVFDLTSRTLRQITSDGYPKTGPSWFPDGSAVVCVKWIAGFGQIWKVPLAGDGWGEPITASSRDHDEPRIAPDGEWLTYRAQVGGDGRENIPWHIFASSLGGQSGERLLTDPRDDQMRSNPVWLPNGSAVIFASGLANRSLRDPAQLRAVATGLGCGTGNVSAGSPPISFTTLTVNGKIGGNDHEMFVSAGSRVSLLIASPPAGPAPAPFVLYLAPFRDRERSELPDGIGLMCFASPIVGGTPLTLFNTLGREKILGRPLLSAHAAPFHFSARMPSTGPHILIIQGFIRDDGSLNPYGFSVTNAIVVRSQ